MPKLKKTITNQAKPEELKEKIEAIDESETPEVTPETPTELSLEEVRAKDPSELKDEEQTFLEENADNLTDEEKVKFSIIEETPVTTPETPTETPEVTDDTDWKARYRGSTQEAQVLASKNKDLVDSVDEAAKLPDPTDEEMQKEYGEDWDMMDNVQKKIAKESLLNKRRFEVVDQAVQRTKKSEEWIEKVKEFTQDPKTVEFFPKLKGKETEFTQFCSMPSRVGVAFEDLVKAFLFDLPPERPQRKSLFETKGGGSAPKVKELTPEEVKFIRETEPRKYKQLIKDHKINIEV